MNVHHRAFERSTGSTDTGAADDLVARARVLADHLANVAAEADASAAIPARTWDAVRRSGVLTAPFAAADGGEDLLGPDRHVDLVAVLRRIGGGDLGVGRLFEGHVNGIALVRRHGTSAQRAALADAVAGGALSGVWGADGANALRAERVDGAWRLTGGKILASGAGFVTHPVVTARSDAGQIMVLPRLARGERVDLAGWTAQGMRATATGSVDLTGMTLAAEQVLGGPGDFTRQPHFSGGAWRFCAVHLGATERLLDLFRDHLLSRGRAEDPYQLQRVATSTAAVATAAFWVADAARRLAGPDPDPDETVAFVNLTRMVTERAALDVLEAVHRGVGLSGFIRPHPIERITRDLSTYLRQPVPDLAMADAARTVLASPYPTADLWSRRVEG